MQVVLGLVVGAVKCGTGASKGAGGGTVRSSGCLSCLPFG